MKRQCFTNATRTMLSLTLVITSTATYLVAQDPVLDGQAIPAQPALVFGMSAGVEMPSKEKLGGAKQFQMMRLYAMEIRRVEAAAKLEDAQKTKLSIGAKGLAKKKSQEFVKNMMGMGMGMVMPVGGAAPAAPPKNNEPEVKFVEIKSFNDIDANTKAMLDGFMSPEAKPYDDADWLKLVKGVLKPEQYTKYEQVLAANKLNTDKAMVDAEVAKLSKELALSKDQESKLTALVLEQLAKDKHAPGTTDQNMMELQMAMQMMGSQLTLELTKMDSAKLRSIFTAPQFEQVNLKLEVLKSNVGQMNPDIQVAPLEGK